MHADARKNFSIAPQIHHHFLNRNLFCLFLSKKLFSFVLVVDKTGLETEFEQLNKRTLTEHDTDDELLNATRNRYIKRVPCEDSRVRLSVNPELYDTEYIDANFIDSYYLSENFIATRAPLMKTVAEFWRMVWEYDCCTVVMLMSQEVCFHFPFFFKSACFLAKFILSIFFVYTSVSGGGSLFYKMKLLRKKSHLNLESLQENILNANSR